MQCYLVANINRPKQGQPGYNNNNGHTRLMSAYLIRVARAHNLPSLEALTRGMTTDRIRASHKWQMWLHWKSPVRWHLTNDMTEFIPKVYL